MAKAHGKDVLVALVAAMASDAALPSPTAPGVSTPCALWAFASDDAFTPKGDDGERLAYSVLRPFGGANANHTQNRLSVQCYCNGPTAAATYAQLEALFNALLVPVEDIAPASGPPGLPTPEPTPGVPRREWGIDGYVVQIFALSPPALLGSDAEGRIDGSFNFEVGYRPAA